MKTSQTITAIIALTITTWTYAEMNADNSLRIEIREIKLPTCNGAANGSISIEAKGGKTPYAYSWNTYPEQTTSTATNLEKGIYFIQVTDAQGTIYFESVEIKDPIETSLNASAPLTTQNGATSNWQNTMTIESNVQNEFQCYLDGERLTEPLITGLDAGIHKLVIVSGGCTVMQFIQVAELQQTNRSNENDVITVAETTPLTSLENLEEDNFNVAISMVQNE